MGYDPARRRRPSGDDDRVVVVVFGPGHDAVLDDGGAVLVERYMLAGVRHEVAHPVPWDLVAEPPAEVADALVRVTCSACGERHADTPARMAEWIAAHPCPKSRHAGIRPVPSP